MSAWLIAIYHVSITARGCRDLTGGMWLLLQRRTDDLCACSQSRTFLLAKDSTRESGSACLTVRGPAYPRSQSHWTQALRRACWCRGTGPFLRVPSCPHPHGAVIWSRSFTNCVISRAQSCFSGSVLSFALPSSPGTVCWGFRVPFVFLIIGCFL